MSIRLTVKGPSGEQFIDCDCYGTFVVGRSEEAQICVAEDNHFSRRHCWIEIAPPHAKVVDLKSHNGTLVNGKRISSVWLNDGDVISGGQTEIRISNSTDCDADKTLTLETTSPARLAETASIDISEPPLPNIPPQFEKEQIGRYKIIEEVGRGDMGIVYKATQLPTQQLAAVKLIIPSGKVNEKQAQLFLREASILSSLNHKRIVQLLEFGIDAGDLFMATEYVEHRTLAEWGKGMSRAGQIRLACGVVAQTLDALDYAHGEGVVHRDIKPANLLLSQEKSKLAVRVADFGLAKNYIHAGFSGITRDGEVRGTLGFIAPEQLVNSQKSLPESDLFSIGATLYYFLCGQYVYDDPSGEHPVQTILGQGPTPLSHRNLDIPKELIEFVDRAIQPIPAERFASAAEMRKEINPFLRKR